jgi:hypothetical protein
VIAINQSPDLAMLRNMCLFPVPIISATARTVQMLARFAANSSIIASTNDRSANRIFNPICVSEACSEAC